eukprot:CAMPEP_0171939774 /NCGR_PEP_ID=MMETSP0993-20121228/36595_1 /TAXON_ID=483369 /ORGANISM="non described non described, Strain CCMP2098" /LENGTH=430 /DNA_ID=CAMNT_0012581687 /DNA_START=16 /DNA_END=1308 /DNA_ORIENTATION=-
MMKFVGAIALTFGCHVAVAFQPMTAINGRVVLRNRITRQPLHFRCLVLASRLNNDDDDDNEIDFDATETNKNEDVTMLASSVEDWVRENPALAAVPVLLVGALFVGLLVSALGGLIDPSSLSDASGSGSELSSPSFALTTAAAGTTAAQSYDPRTFVPVCGVSDVVYRYLQGSALALVGRENYEAYAPLIAGGILRIRLELCVLESFLNEAILPFVREKGLSWVLPLHETVETFLAGTVFAVATNFILLGSTKIVAVLVAYTDVLFGLPARLVGSALFKAGYRGLVDEEKALEDAIATGRVLPPPRGRKSSSGGGEEAAGQGGGPLAAVAEALNPFKPRRPPPPPPPTLLEELGDVVNCPSQAVGSGEKGPLLALLGVGSALRVAGGATKTGREVLELFDTFVGRYLVYSTFGYVTVKFLHFKVFPDFPF